MLRKFCENLKKHCLMVFLLSLTLGVSTLIGCFIRWAFVEPGEITKGAAVMMALSAVGLGVLIFSPVFGFFGDQIMAFVSVLDILSQKMSNGVIDLINYVYERRELKRQKASIPKPKNKIIIWLEELDEKYWEKEAYAKEAGATTSLIYKLSQRIEHTKSKFITIRKV